MVRRGPRTVYALALAMSLAGLFIFFTSSATAVTLPAGFEETTVLPGVGKPQDIAIAPNGRVFVAEKTGFIRTYDSTEDTTPTLFADLRVQVHNYGSRGLLSIVADPGFPAKPYVYVYYTMDAPLGGTPPVYGGGSFDACPKYTDSQDADLDKSGVQPIGEVDNCPAGSRISRLQIAGEVMTGTEKVLVEDFCQQFAGHAGGGLGFDKDGKLIASASDGSTSQFWDWGQSGSPTNPCGDPPGGVGSAMTRPTSEGGRLRAQDIRTTSDPLGLSGSVIRIDPATGKAVDGSTSNSKRLIAYGLRDPSRLAVRPGTNDVWVADRGGGYWEEFHRIDSYSRQLNFGWPCYENDAKRLQSDLQDLTMCEQLYADKLNLKSPFWAYDHELNVHPSDNCESKDVRSGSTISGLEFYPAAGGNFPPMYRNALLFADRLRSCIWALLPDANGIPKKGSVVPLAGMAKRATDLEVTPTGDLLYIDQGNDTVKRIRYTVVNKPPAAVATASVTSGLAPLTVTFNGLGSTDSEAGVLTYAWDLDGDNLLDDSTVAQPTFNYATPGTYTVTLRVTDPEGAFSTATVVIKVNAPPKAVATANVTAGTAPLSVTFNGSASTDPDVGDTLSYAWDLDGDTLLDDSTTAQPTFNYTTPGTYTVTLKVTDKAGAFSTANVVITVNAVPNAAPSAVATANVTSGTAPLAVSFSGLGSTDADGDALTYAWDLDGDNLLDDSTAAQPTFNYTTPGTYAVTLKVTDTKGASSTAIVGIAVQAATPTPDPGPGPRTSPFVPIVKPGSYVQGTTLSGVIQGANVSQSADAGQPARAIITTASAKADGTRPGATFEIKIHLPAGMVRNTSTFATCHPTTLETHGPQGCPAGAVIGTGSAVFDAWPVVVDYVDAQVTIVNGPGGSVLLHVLPELGPAFVIEGQPLGNSALEFAVPPIYTVPGAPLGALAQLTLDLQSSGYLTNPADCPTAGFTWGFDFLYESGERLSSSLRVRCAGGLPAPVTIAPTLSLPLPAAKVAVVRDTTKPVALAAGPANQDIDKLFVRASTNEAGTVTVTGSVNVPGASKGHRFKAVTRTVKPNHPVKLSPKLSRRSLKLIKRALKRGKSIKATITITVTDQAGNATVQKRTIRLRP